MNLTPPSYLKGVEDIRPEADGGVSFYDPKNLTGAFGKENNRTRLSPDQARWTFDNTLRLSNLDKAINKQYKGLDSTKSPEQMIMDSIGEKVRSAARWATNSPEKARTTTGALSALGAGGAVLGLGMGVTPALVAALGVGGIGALLSGLSQRQLRLRHQNKAANNMSTAILSNPGALRMLAATGLDKNAGAQAIGYDEALREHGLPVHQQIAKFASALFEPTHHLHHLYDGLSKAATWVEEYDEFTDCVCRALNRHGLDKSALLPVAVAAHDKLGGGVLKSLLGAGAIAGAGVGTLGFVLNRDSQQSSAEASALLEKIRTYKRLRRDIEEDIANHQAKLER